MSTLAHMCKTWCSQNSKIATCKQLMDWAHHVSFTLAGVHQLWSSISLQLWVWISSIELISWWKHCTGSWTWVLLGFSRRHDNFLGTLTTQWLIEPKNSVSETRISSKREVLTLHFIVTVWAIRGRHLEILPRKLVVSTGPAKQDDVLQERPLTSRVVCLVHWNR